MKRLVFMTLLVALASVTALAQLTDRQNISSKNFVMKIIHDENFLYVGTKGGGIVKIDKQERPTDGAQTRGREYDGKFHYRHDTTRRRSVGWHGV